MAGVGDAAAVLESGATVHRIKRDSLGAHDEGGRSEAMPVLLFEGEVVRGFGRGSKLLGCPTANIPIEPYKAVLEKLSAGVYFGFCTLNSNAEALSDNDEVMKMVMSIGWNPYFQNKEKTIETHILREFADDFYGAHLKLCVVGYIRAEANFASLDDLKDAIANDIRVASEALEHPNFSALATHDFLTRANQALSKAL